MHFCVLCYDRMYAWKLLHKILRFMRWKFIKYLSVFHWTEKCTLPEGKGNGTVDLYSASSQTPLMHSDIDNATVTVPANNLPLTVTIPQVAPPRIYAWVQLTTHLSTQRGWMAELAMLADIPRTVYPEEVTRQLHVMVQARESLPVIDWRSNHCDTPPTDMSWTHMT